MMLFLNFSVCATAADAYPESEHNYPDNANLRYEYTCPEAKYGMFIRFSADTYFEDTRKSYFPVFFDESGEITVGSVLEAKENAKNGDRLHIYSKSGLVGSYTGYDLASETVYVEGDTVTLVLESDESVNYYGFRIESIEPATASPDTRVTFHTGYGTPETYFRKSKNGNGVRVDNEPYYTGKAREGYAFVGWSTTPDGLVEYTGGEMINEGTHDLYAVWCPTCLESNEVFRFTNSAYYFSRGEEEGVYYMTKEDLDTLEKNIFKTFGPSPVPGIVLGIVLATYPNWEWRGSCYGISAVTALQHFGMIDVKSLQDAEDLVDMTTDDALISYINYYQANAATSWLCENKAVTPGTAEYAASMEDMFESVKNGNLVLYTFYSGSSFITPGHTVLLTGAYDDAQGNHNFVAYDCNHSYRYTSSNKSDRFVLSPDFKQMTDDNGKPVGSANWTDNFNQFESFNINGEGSATSWYSSFFNQLWDSFVRLFSILGKLFKIK